jgi:hypothetical protein
MLHDLVGWGKMPPPIILNFDLFCPLLFAGESNIEFLKIAIGYSKMMSETVRKGVNINTTPKIEFLHKYQNYIKMMREVNPTYQPSS